MKTLPSTIRQHVTNENGAFEENRKFSILYLYYIDWTFKLNFRTILKYFRLVIIDSKIKGINRAWFLISALDLRRLSKEEPQVFSSKFFFSLVLFPLWVFHRYYVWRGGKIIKIPTQCLEHFRTITRYLTLCHHKIGSRIFQILRDFFCGLRSYSFGFFPLWKKLFLSKYLMYISVLLIVPINILFFSFCLTIVCVSMFNLLILCSYFFLLLKPSSEKLLVLL